MLVIPAIDIRNGKCVRLIQGKADRETVYNDNPLETALKWEQMGAPMLHIVDLDGAFEGTPQNASLIESILFNVHVPVQVGGGIRSPASVEKYLGAGADRVVVGTLAYHNFAFVNEMADKHPGKLVLGLDAKDGMIAVNGWVRKTKITAVELAKEYASCPVAAFVYTDVARDGMLCGPNLPAIAEFARSVDAPVIASGGVQGIQDIRDLLALNQSNVQGVIVGKALYTGDVLLSDALEAAGQHAGQTDHSLS